MNPLPSIANIKLTRLTQTESPDANGHNQAGSGEQTTTLHSTATETVTLVEVPTTSVTAGSGGEGNCSPTTVTVTETVYAVRTLLAYDVSAVAES
jgi:hypothetical protein